MLSLVLDGCSTQEPPAVNPGAPTTPVPIPAPAPAPTQDLKGIEQDLKNIKKDVTPPVIIKPNQPASPPLCREKRLT